MRWEFNYKGGIIMKKRNTTKRQIREVKNDCNWFDTDNARLIILCALFGFVGAHKFAMGKKGQGWLFIILDLTIVGIIVSAVWAFLDLLSLTIKKDNKPGNMILGSVFLLFSLISFFPASVAVFNDNSKPEATGVKNTDNELIEEPIFDGKMTCVGQEGADTTVFVKLYNSSLIIDFADDNSVLLGYALTMPGGNKVYTDTFDANGKVVKQKDKSKHITSMAFMQDANFTGKLNIKGPMNGVKDDYICQPAK